MSHLVDQLVDAVPPHFLHLGVWDRHPRAQPPPCAAHVEAGGCRKHARPTLCRLGLPGSAGTACDGGIEPESPWQAQCVLGTHHHRRASGCNEQLFPTLRGHRPGWDLGSVGPGLLDSWGGPLKTAHLACRPHGSLALPRQSMPPRRTSASGSRPRSVLQPVLQGMQVPGGAAEGQGH